MASVGRVGRPGVVVSALLLLAAGLAASAVAVGATSFACPAAPSGWTPASGGAQFWGPDQNPGADTERITCSYLNTKGEGIGVVVNFALPTDLNPIDDFYYGCNGLGAVAWTHTQRVYQLTSATHWMDANFSDPYHLTPAGQVTQFEDMARLMLATAQPLAHACSVKVAPTPALAGWLFDFEFALTGKTTYAFGGIGTHVPAQGKIAGVPSYPIPDGSFQTKGSAQHPTVATVSAPVVALSVVTGSTKRTVTIKLVSAIRFSFTEVQTGQQAVAALLLQVRVVHSTLAACPVGSQGTLELSTVPASVSLKLCAPVFGKLASGPPTVTIQQS
jgi:hypothetical protein